MAQRAALAARPTVHERKRTPHRSIRPGDMEKREEAGAILGSANLGWLARGDGREVAHVENGLGVDKLAGR